MLNLLKGVQKPEDIKELSIPELKKLAKEIRVFLVQSIAKTGGHLASNLGVVELTIAMHYVFDSPKDKMIWDVGHQSYVHKLLTGRRKKFKSLRKFEGLCGFPKKKESIHDVFETGHSSTSISAALGMAVARDLNKENHEVLAVIGDGALTGGMSFEALNDAGRGNTHLIVILNDNEMSISKNVGGLCKHLNRLRSNKEYQRAKEDVQDVLNQVPVIGEHVVSAIRRTKGSLKSFLLQNTLFEQIGFTYVGPVDGHNIEDLIEILENAKGMKGPILIHVKTKKGKGYALAEQTPSKFHGIAPFDIRTGEGLVKTKQTKFSSAFGNAMCELAKENLKIAAITAAMPEGTGLSLFSELYPERFFDVGIAEQHAVTFAAGLATEGYIPVFAVYSSFLQRGYDQVLHDVCLQELPVIFGVDRAGLVGEDGQTHQGIFDIAYLSMLPKMTILSPKVPEEIEQMLRYAITLHKPVAIRYPRGTASIEDRLVAKDTVWQHHTLVQGDKTAALFATGKAVLWALEVSKKLEGKLTVVEVPKLDKQSYLELVPIMKEHHYCFTIEDGICSGGFGQKLFATAIKEKVVVKGENFGYEEGIVEHGSIDQLLEKYQLSPNYLAKQITSWIQEGE